MAISSYSETDISTKFGGGIYTRSTGGANLTLPLEDEDNNPAEIIKRALPTDSETLKEARMQNKAQVRIIIDDINAGSGSGNLAGMSDTMPTFGTPTPVPVYSYPYYPSGPNTTTPTPPKPFVPGDLVITDN